MLQNHTQSTESIIPIFKESLVDDCDCKAHTDDLFKPVRIPRSVYDKVKEFPMVMHIPKPKGRNGGRVCWSGIYVWALPRRNYSNSPVSTNRVLNLHFCARILMLRRSKPMRGQNSVLQGMCIFNCQYHRAQKQGKFIKCYGYVPIPYVTNDVHSTIHWMYGWLLQSILQHWDSRRITITVVTSTFVHIVLYVDTFTVMYIGTLGTYKQWCT